MRLWSLVLLLASPLLHLAARASQTLWLNFGSPNSWDQAVYLILAPHSGQMPDSLPVRS